MTQEDWERVRVQAAIAAMQGYCSLESNRDTNFSDIAFDAVRMADRLVKELQEEK